MLLAYFLCTLTGRRGRAERARGSDVERCPWFPPKNFQQGSSCSSWRWRLAASGLGLLTEWLSTHSVGIGSNVVLAPGDSPLAARSVEAGETLLELRSGACLTARAAYADRELGRDLQDIAAQVGPGFDTVALATLCAAERVRGFQAEAWYAGSSAAEQAPCTPHHAH